jgi:hypothetical protein
MFRAVEDMNNRIIRLLPEEKATIAIVADTRRLRLIYTFICADVPEIGEMIGKIAFEFSTPEFTVKSISAGYPAVSGMYSERRKFMFDGIAEIVKTAFCEANGWPLVISEKGVYYKTRGVDSRKNGV